MGKSTFYNRMVGGRQAIVDDVSGVTRDRMYGTCEWNGKTFTVVDTGGFVRDSDEVFEVAIRDQVKIAIEEAGVIIFLVDVTTGITDLDLQMANMLRRSDKPVILGVNKVDNHQRMMDANEFWSLGFDETYFLAAISGSGTGDLLDVVTEKLADDANVEESNIPKFAIVGRPNVGKSSLTNALLGVERNIVTPIAGTTRDPIHSTYSKFGKEFMLIDTAGIRKKRKVHEDLEFYSVMRAIRAIEESDVCFLMVDAQTGIEAQDMSIFNLAKKRNKGLVLLVNKWDLVDKETNTARDMEAELKKKMAPFVDLPVVFISALEKQRIFKAIEAGIEVNNNRNQKIKTSVLNEVIGDAIEAYEPPSHRGKFIKIKYITQLPTYYPAFAFFCNYPKHIKESYRNYLENQLRKNFNFKGVPIGIFFRKK